MSNIFSNKSKEIQDELKIIQELVTVKTNVSPLQLKIVLRQKFSTIIGCIDKLEKDDEELDKTKIKNYELILNIISDIEFRKPVGTSDLIWLNMYYFRIVISRNLMVLYDKNVTNKNYDKTLSIILNVPKFINLEEVEESDEELAFRLFIENFRLLQQIIISFENTKIYNFKEWLNNSLKNHFTLINYLRDNWSVMNYAQKNNFKDLSVIIRIYQETMHLFISLYSVIRNNKYLLEPTDLFNTADDFQFISAIIRIKEELDIKTKELNDFRDDQDIDDAIVRYEQYRFIPDILFHIREMLISNYSDSKLISFCSNDITLISDYLTENKQIVTDFRFFKSEFGRFTAENMKYYLYVVGLISSHSKDINILEKFKATAGNFLSAAGMQEYTNLYNLFLTIKLCVSIESNDINKIAGTAEEILSHSSVTENKDRHYFSLQLMGNLARLLTGKISKADFIVNMDTVISLCSGNILNELLLANINEYIKTLYTIIDGGFAEYDLKKLNNPSPFDPLSNFIPNFDKIPVSKFNNILYIPFNLSSDAVY